MAALARSVYRDHPSYFRPCDKPNCASCFLGWDGEEGAPDVLAPVPSLYGCLGFQQLLSPKRRTWWVDADVGAWWSRCSPQARTAYPQEFSKG